MNEIHELREAAALARRHREHVLTTIRSGDGTPAMHRVLARLERDYSRAAKALDQLATDLDTLVRLNEGNPQ